MLHVFICEDNPSHKKQIQKCVENCIMIHDLDMKLVLSTHDPEAIIDYIRKEKVSGLYFLDVNLNHRIDGVVLARTIREYDPRCFIVFITTHDEALPLAVQHMVEPMGFILKEEFYELQEKVYACILNAQAKYTAKATELQKNFSFRIFDKLITVEYSNILYFETSGIAHKVRLHMKDGVYEFYGGLNDLAKTLDESFYRCHNSIIVNLKQCLQLDMAGNIIYFDQGSSCPVSGRRMKGLVSLLENTKH